MGAITSRDLSCLVQVGEWYLNARIWKKNKLINSPDNQETPLQHSAMFLFNVTSWGGGVNWQGHRPIRLKNGSTSYRDSQSSSSFIISDRNAAHCVKGKLIAASHLPTMWCAEPWLRKRKCLVCYEYSFLDVRCTICCKALSFHTCEMMLA